MATDLSREQVIERFGVDPDLVGMRNRGWFVLASDPDQNAQHDLFYAEAKAGDLCVDTRDPGGGQFDAASMKLPNYAGLAINSFDPTYAYYIFRPLSSAVLTRADSIETAARQLLKAIDECDKTSSLTAEVDALREALS